MKSKALSRVILVGFSGSGKSTVGKIIAAQLGCELVDVDELVEGKAGRSITELIRVEGEEAFRARESEALREALSLGAVVVVVGGGALLSEVNRKLIEKESFVVSLDVSVKAAVERVLADEHSAGAVVKRPLLASASKSREAVTEEVRKLKRKRDGLYDIGVLRILTDYFDANGVSGIIARELSLRANRPLGEEKFKSAVIPMSDSEILIGSNLRGELLRRLQEKFPKAKKFAVVFDSNIAEKWGEALREILKPVISDCCFITIPAGETSKRLSFVEQVCDKMLAAGMTRSDVVVGVGGGVVGDLSGLVASLFMRGVGLVHVPTTVVAQVDSAIGGKTGVNLAGGKNLLGTFREGELILIDTDFLSTLPEREYVAGLAEVVKYGLIDSEEFFEWIEQNVDKVKKRERGAITKIVEVSAQTKVRFVRDDLRDVLGLRAMLNFGHTVGHALEQLSDYGRFLHGEAVAIGMVKALEVGEMLGKTPKEIRPRVLRLLSALGLPTEVPTDFRIGASGSKSKLLDGWQKALSADKKRVTNYFDYVVVEELGRAALAKVDVETVLKVLQ